MKYTKILTGMTMGLMLATTSCRDDTFNDYWDNSDEFTVNIKVALEDMVPASRAGESNASSIGCGSRIDMLVYAVYYDKNKADGITGEEPNWQAATAYVKEYDEGKEPFGGNYNIGYGQSIVDVSNTLKKGEPYPLTLTLKKGHDYQVVFWAQNSKTDAFVIDDLKMVQMKYKLLDESDKQNDKGENIHQEDIKSVNNDESRDAFCRSISLNGNQSNQNLTIYLKRPLAQINVGTLGYDFETITRNADKKYLYSKIRINKAARFYNAVEDYTYTSTTENPTYDDPNPSSTEAFYTIDYEYEKIPAYWQMEIPKYPSYTKYDADNFETIFHHAGETGLEITDKTSFEAYYKDEEFLKVHLYKDAPDSKGEIPDKVETDDNGQGGYYPYASMGVGDTTPSEVSEIFKYLSMCYVLTATDDKNSETLNNVTVWLNTEPDGSGDEVEIVNVNNVPVQRNHRTNIVGSLLTAEAKLDIIVDEDFAGRKLKGDNSVMSGEITEGFYYDADKDEFQISSVNGLLFFQQLVNGDLTVRQSIDSKYIGKPYVYYDENGMLEYSLKFKSHPQNELKDKANIIINGSKYNEFGNNQKKVTLNGDEWTIKIEKDQYGWPVNNNFPFYGATVKLMADIDLSGIEWIPIGYDCANWDSSLYPSVKYNEGMYDSKINYKTLNSNEKEVSLGKRRAFCGTFDGNGHTIYNLKTKRFGANIHPSGYQKYTYNEKDKSNTKEAGPYDNVQWFAYGLFGVVGPGAEIKDLRLQNIDVKGYNAVGGVVGQVSSLGFPAKIINCVVDGGSIDVVPMYRGEYKPEKEDWYGRTMARGVYVGGIVGQFCAKDNGNEDIAEISGCEVRNVTIQGYRRMGGIVGAIADQNGSSHGVKDIQLDITVKNNAVRNSILLVNQYRAFNYFWDSLSDNKEVWMNGFGWTGGGYSPMTDNIVGGYYSSTELAKFQSSSADTDAFKGDKYYVKNNKYQSKEDYFNEINNNGNQATNLKYCELSVQPDNATNKDSKGNRGASYRISDIESLPLKYIPMFTSLFTDKVNLNDNYYGETKLHTKLDFKKPILWEYNNVKYNYYSIPINFPNDYEILYLDSSPLTGMYLESVDLNGKGAPGGRSVITPLGVETEGACVMYITARDFYQFKDEGKQYNKPGSEHISDDDIDKLYKKKTVVSNVVLRGSPYAWAGITLAPNKNMSEVTLNNVSIYDVYKTLTLQEKGSVLQNSTIWDKYEAVNLNLNNCNLRGYTDPGNGWSHITYTKTTFEQGSQTKYSYDEKKNANGTPDEGRYEYKTCKIDAPTTFDHCFFKAPYCIDLTYSVQSQIKFNECFATSVYENVKIDIPAAEKKAGGQSIKYIEIGRDTQSGKTIVKYFRSKTDPNPVEL